MLTRTATDAELIASIRFLVTKLRFRHFTKEFRRVPFVKDGQLFVNFQGRDQKLTGTHYTLSNGMTFVADVRIDISFDAGGK